MLNPSKGKLFIAGLLSGAVVVANWRSLLKRFVRWSLLASARVQKVVATSVENLSDITEEARFELRSPGDEP
jgi:hypothetical protein